MPDEREVTGSIHVTLVPRFGILPRIELDVDQNVSILLRSGGQINLRGRGGIISSTQDETRVRVDGISLIQGRRVRTTFGTLEVDSRVHAGQRTTYRSDQYIPDTVVIAEPANQNDAFIYHGRRFPKMVIEMRRKQGES